MVYVLSVYNKKDKYNRITVSSFLLLACELICYLLFPPIIPSIFCVAVEIQLRSWYLFFSTSVSLALALKVDLWTSKW